MSIPKIIHYCWFGKSELPAESQGFIDEWKKICQDYKFIRWDESNYDINKNRYIKEAYKRKKWAFVSDYVRLDVVNTYGGIYLDVDVQLIKNFDDFLKYKSFWGIEKNFDNKLFVNNGLGFGAEKNNVILKDLLHLYERYDLDNDDISFIPCTNYQLDVFCKYGFRQKNIIQNLDNNMIFSTQYFSPKNFFGKIKIKKHTVSIHHFYASWLEKSEIDIAYYRLVNIFGYFIVYR